MDTNFVPMQQGLVDYDGLKTIVWRNPETAPPEASFARLRRMGKIPHIRLAGRFYYDPAKVLAALSKLAVGGREVS